MCLLDVLNWIRLTNYYGCGCDLRCCVSLLSGTLKRAKLSSIHANYTASGRGLKEAIFLGCLWSTKQRCEDEFKGFSMHTVNITVCWVYHQDTRHWICVTSYHGAIVMLLLVLVLSEEHCHIIIDQSRQHFVGSWAEINYISGRSLFVLLAFLVSKRTNLD